MLHASKVETLDTLTTPIPPLPLPIPMLAKAGGPPLIPAGPTPPPTPLNFNLIPNRAAVFIFLERFILPLLGALWVLLLFYNPIRVPYSERMAITWTVFVFAFFLCVLVARNKH